MGFSVCVAAVKCRPELSHSVFTFFWSSEIMDCMLFTFEKGVRSCARGISGVASFLSTNDHLYYKQGCYFPPSKLS